MRDFSAIQTLEMQGFCPGTHLILLRENCVKMPLRRQQRTANCRNKTHIVIMRSIFFKSHLRYFSLLLFIQYFFCKVFFSFKFWKKCFCLTNITSHSSLMYSVLWVILQYMTTLIGWAKEKTVCSCLNSNYLLSYDKNIYRSIVAIDMSLFDQHLFSSYSTRSLK